jgi:hypothetical protein
VAQLGSPEYQDLLFWIYFGVLGAPKMVPKSSCTATSFLKVAVQRFSLLKSGPKEAHNVPNSHPMALKLWLWGSF